MDAANTPNPHTIGIKIEYIIWSNMNGSPSDVIGGENSHDILVVIVDINGCCIAVDVDNDDDVTVE